MQSLDRRPLGIPVTRGCFTVPLGLFLMAFGRISCVPISCRTPCTILYVSENETEAKSCTGVIDSCILSIGELAPADSKQTISRELR
jgi:hypothetical protein